MAGKRLLDVAALFNATRGVLQKHAFLRSRQFEVYNRTSTLAQAVRNQTDRVTDTIKAASFLASRLNEDPPTWTSDDNARTKADGDNSIPSRKSTAGPPRPPSAEGIDQDHFYEPSTGNSAVGEPPQEELPVQQEKADRYPLPDGTIPPSESDLDSHELDHEVISNVSRVEPSKKPSRGDGIKPVSGGESTIPCPVQTVSSPEPAHQAQIPARTVDALEASVSDPLNNGRDEDSFYQHSTCSSPASSSLPGVKVPEHTSSTQGGDSHSANRHINSDTFYTQDNAAAIPSVQAIPDQQQLPDGVDTDLFYSPRVASMLGGRTMNNKLRGELHLEAASNTPIDRTLIGKDKDQDTFNVRPPSEDTIQDTSNPPSSEARVSLHHSAVEEDSIEGLANNISREVDQSSHQNETYATAERNSYALRESKVPSTRLSRIWNYGGLAAGMFGGAITESLRRVSGSGGQGSYMLSAGNMERLVTKLSRMRGAALKLGQMISFQDSKMLPAAIQEVLQRVQDRADYMPASQRDKVLTANLGSDWRSLFTTFDEKPLAAASIGQVHSAVLKSNGARVAVKIQYPGVADSIDSDLSNLSILLTASRLLPKGLFLEKTIANARIELSWECDYIREAECGRRFEALLADERDVFDVPMVYPEASGQQVLTMQFMEGIGVTRVQSFSQVQKDWIGTQILRLCLREITEFKFMQTDPNWTNFLYNSKTNRLELLDFGASREYPTDFISKYTRLLAAAARSDRQTVRDLSIELGYLTGQESAAMLNAHIASVLTLAEPFLDSSPELYNFKDQTITDRVKEQIPLMIRERLAPPPEETYSLHRKLSGAFLLCARLGSRVRCRELFKNSMSKVELL
ncbi:ABC1-domain-containing protein [Mollisia scopiformis]|uniref:ABC1-domain-containing protein n=1 Tax=Mollisia scopiformis TaxID=149040 RepID=A0A194XJB9_MOLSC|nr:ABC1-domain-containing protein [Mollisia scopiformis]KUJ20221.1 ABC1-domain-containing protein [Mollisia scopiformis]